jgi:hypothetical protein
MGGAAHPIAALLEREFFGRQIGDFSVAQRASQSSEVPVQQLAHDALSRPDLLDKASMPLRAPSRFAAAVAAMRPSITAPPYQGNMPQ